MDGLHHPGETLLAADLRVALSAEYAADGTRSTEPAGDANHLRFTVDSALSLIRIGVGEIRRAAEHGHGEAGLLDGFANCVEVGRIEALEKTLIHLETVGVERARHLNPLEDGHRPF